MNFILWRQRPAMKHKKKRKEKIKARGPSGKEQEKVASSLLNRMDSLNPEEVVGLLPDADTAAAFISLMPLKDGASLPVLAALKDAFKDKQVLKAIKRVLFKLDNKGISTDGFFEKEKAPSILRALPKDEPRCLVGAIDGFGYRSFALILKRNMQGTDVAFGVVSDENGIEHMMLGTAKKKRAIQVIEEFSQSSGPMVETSLHHVATLLEKAHQKNRELQRELSESYLELRPWLLENASLLNHAIIFDQLPESWTQDQPLANREVDSLLDQEVMHSWIIDYGRLKPFMEEIAAIEESPIILTEMQKAVRAMEIKEKCGRAVFPPEKSGLLKERLEEMAYFFLKRNDEKNARTCLKSSTNFSDGDSLFSKSLFIEKLVEKSMSLFDAAGGQGFAEGESEGKPASGPFSKP